jgi:peptidoglycan/xylan/chitin deacetylase (PgdA/CDA1 family)
MLKELAVMFTTSLRRSMNRLANVLDPPLIILVYHRVCMLDDDPFQLAVAPVNFREQICYLRDHWPVVRLSEALHKRTDPAVAITFDDGYADNLLHALPILEECRVPATFFVTTGYLDMQREYWWDQLELLKVSVSERMPPEDNLHTMLRKLPPDEREKCLDALFTRRSTEPRFRQTHRPLTSVELQQMADSEWADIGAHGVSHTAFSALAPEVQHEELIASKTLLQELLQREISLFSYPFGKADDYTHASVAFCKDCGFSLAVANIPGQVHRWTDPYQLPRHLVRNWPVAEFASQVSRFFTA